MDKLCITVGLLCTACPQPAPRVTHGSLRRELSTVYTAPVTLHGILHRSPAGKRTFLGAAEREGPAFTVPRFTSDRKGGAAPRAFYLICLNYPKKALIIYVKDRSGTFRPFQAADPATDLSVSLTGTAGSK